MKIREITGNPNFANALEFPTMDSLQKHVNDLDKQRDKDLYLPLKAKVLKPYGHYIVTN